MVALEKSSSPAIGKSTVAVAPVSASATTDTSDIAEEGREVRVQKLGLE